MSIQKILILLTIAMNCKLYLCLMDKMYININIDNRTSQIDGFFNKIIPNEVRTAFKINDAELKRDIKKIFGAEPSDVFVRSPTPWNDLYKRFGWKEVNHILGTRWVKILNKTSAPATLFRQKFDNSASMAVNFSSWIGNNYTIPIRIVHERVRDYKSNSEDEVNYEYSLISSKYMPPLKIHYKTFWKSSFHEERIDMKFANNITEKFTVEPHDNAVHQIVATKITVEIEVQYFEYLYGLIAINYEKPHQGHHFWVLDVERLLNESQKPLKILSSEKIVIEYYKNVFSELNYKNGGSKRTEVALVEKSF